MIPRSPGGHGVADVLFGDVNPGGKLPVSFPRRVGQVPIYYDHEPTGRPCDRTEVQLALPRHPVVDPLFEFGFGLSYTTFEVSNLRLSRDSVGRNGSLQASVDVSNTGGRPGDEVVPAVHPRPGGQHLELVRRLRGSERVRWPGRDPHRDVHARQSDFGFYDNSGVRRRARAIDVYAGTAGARTWCSRSR